MSDNKVFWAVCVRVNEKKVKKYKASGFYELNVLKKEYWPFDPEKGYNKKSRYGRIVAEDVIVYNILKLTDDMQLLEDMIANPRKHRIGCGPRLSLEESVYRVKDFRLVQEAEDAKADISEPKVLAAKKASSSIFFSTVR